MFEEEVGRAVQRYRGLAGARTTLDNEHLVDVRTNDDVLLTLDRRNDLTHLTAAFGSNFGKDRVRNLTGDIATATVTSMYSFVIASAALLGPTRVVPGRWPHP